MPAAGTPLTTRLTAVLDDSGGSGSAALALARFAPLAGTPPALAECAAVTERPVVTTAWAGPAAAAPSPVIPVTIAAIITPADILLRLPIQENAETAMTWSLFGETSGSTFRATPRVIT
jgi:hypothetical protein